MPRSDRESEGVDEPPRSECRRRRGCRGGPRGTRRTARTRRPTAAVQRAVAERDGEQCTYVSPDGRRCEEKRLEFDHIKAAALGGPPTVTNIRLRCRTHNGMAARQQFGDAYVELRAAGFRPNSSATASTRPPGGDRSARSDMNERLDLFD